jgi:hypothetical protein
MKIEFFDKEYGDIKDFQEDFVVNSKGLVLRHKDHDTYGYGFWVDKHTDWRVIDE